MAFSIINQTGSTVGPYNGVTIPSHGTYVVSDPVAAFARDNQLQVDAINNVVFLQVGSVQFSNMNSFNLLLSLVNESSVNTNNAILPAFSTLIAGSDGTNIRPLATDSSGHLLTSAAVVSNIPAATFSSQQSINSGVTLYTQFTAAQKLAIKQFYAGGTGIGKQTLYSYLSATNQFVSFGDFESTGDVSNWVYTTNGGSGVLTFSTAQYFIGSGSMSLTFTSSDVNHLNGAKQTFSSAQDLSGWRYVTAEFYNTVSSGGAYTRNIAIILTDTNGSTRTYQLSGLSTASPFNTAGWIQMLGEIANPTSFSGVSFDAANIISIELRQWDSANKSGTVYWDTVKLLSQIVPIFPIYHQANASFDIVIDPVFIMNIGDSILIAQTNNDVSRKEYYALAGGVSVT